MADSLAKCWLLKSKQELEDDVLYVYMHVHDDSTEMEETTNQTNPGVDRRQTHLHTLQPLSQCSDLIPKVTLPSTQAVHIPPGTQRSMKNVTTKYVILPVFNLMLIDIIFIYYLDVAYCLCYASS